jgi:hypothetical protein
VTSSRAKDVYVHVGLPKTGTTSLQAAFTEAREEMRSHGVLFPGENHHQQRRAAYDLLGRRIPGDDQQVAGAFRTLVREIRDYDGRAVVISEELLGLATPRAVKRLAHALPDDRLHVVLGVRDLARTLQAAWQQEVMRGGTVRWTEFLPAVRDPREGVRAGVAFWLRHDPLRVLDVWGTVVPRERVHLVTVPRSGTSRAELFDRYCRVLRLPEGTLPHDLPMLNQSLGAVGVEVVRRLNENLGGDLPRRHYTFVVEQGLRAALAEYRDRPLALSVDELPWVLQRGQATVDELRRRGHHVEGDLADLTPSDAEAGRRPVEDVSDTELLEATEHALASLARGHGALFRRYRRAVAKQQGERPGPLERLGSASRALAFQARVAALERGDKSVALGWAARWYLRRTRRRG